MAKTIPMKELSAQDIASLTIAEREAIVHRFNARVDAAIAASPPTKEFGRQAMKRQGAPRCPVRIKRLSFDAILRYGDALADLFCEFPDDMVFVAAYDIFVGYQPPQLQDRVNPLDVLLRRAQWTDEWGTVWGHAFGGVGATPLDHPIKDWSQLNDYLAAKVPNPLAAGRLDAVKPVLAMHGKTKYCVGMVHLALFERLHSLRGMQNTFSDFCTNESEVRQLLDALAEYLIALTRSWGTLGMDAIFFTDDWGSQTSLMISPVMWRSFFKEHYRRIFDEAHRLGMDVILHSCGNVMGIVSDLIDVGVDVLDPIQPGAMDIDVLARRFGGQLSFSGGIDIQNLLVSGTPGQIKDAVRRLIDTLGTPFGNGLIVSPANTVTPDVPLENFRALCEAAHNQ
jgi:uroporphyrinogen decarboxylase